MPYKNAEKRKEKSRDAARNRRGKEADVFAELSSLVPISAETVASMDKASIMRVAISHLKLRTLMNKRDLEEQSKCDAQLNDEYLRALGGFIILLDDSADVMYVSDDVTKVLGICQLDLLGANLYDFIHPCDHEELREILDEKDAEEDCRSREHTFFLRHKCTLTSKGRNVNLKSATYKVIRYTGHHLVTESQACLVLIGESIPQPSNMGVPLDSYSFLTQHTMDLRFSYCDDRITELLGYTPEEVTSQPLYEFHHAWDGEAMEKAYKGLFSKGQMWTDRYRFLAKGGGYVWAETQATVIHNSKTDKPQCIVCVHYVLSGVENRGCLMSQVQIKLEKPATIKKEPLCRKTAVVLPTRKSARDGPVMSTESIFAPRSKDGSCMQNDYYFGQMGPGSGETMVSLLDPDEAEVVNLLEDVLFHDAGVDLRTGADTCSSMAPKAMDLPFTTNLASLDMNDDVMPESEAMVRSRPAHALSKCAHLDGVPNLEHLADNPRSTSVDKKKINEQTTMDMEDIEMDMRAPYIPMSGEEDLIFSMVPPVPLIDELDNASNMLGTTESVFAPKPEDPNELKKKEQIPISILRAEAMQKQARQLTGMEIANAQTLPKANTTTETNRLETGPPAKRSRMDLMDYSDDDDFYSSPSSCASVISMVNPDDVTSGSMVLKNLLVKGQDSNNGYDIKSYNTPQNPSKPADNSTLRGLLTGPIENLSPPTSPTRKNQPVIKVDQSTMSPQAKQGSIEVTSTTDTTTSSTVVSKATDEQTTPTDQPTKGTVRRITIRTVGTPSADGSQIVLTDDIIKMLIKFGEAQVLLYNQ